MIITYVGTKDKDYKNITVSDQCFTISQEKKQKTVIVTQVLLTGHEICHNLLTLINIKHTNDCTTLKNLFKQN